MFNLFIAVNIEREANDRERQLYRVYLTAQLTRADKLPSWEEILHPKPDVEPLTGIDADLAAVEFDRIGDVLGVESVWREKTQNSQD